jgi:hypothetical protein
MPSQSRWAPGGGNSRASRSAAWKSPACADGATQATGLQGPDGGDSSAAPMDSTRPGTPQCACVAGPPPPMTASYVVYIRHATIGNRAEQIANEQSCCSMGLPSYRQALASHSIPMRVCGRPQTSRNGNRPSVSAGQPGCGAPRRNRTGDPILTMEPPGTAVRTAASPARARP